MPRATDPARSRRCGAPLKVAVAGALLAAGAHRVVRAVRTPQAGGARVLAALVPPRDARLRGERARRDPVDARLRGDAAAPARAGRAHAGSSCRSPRRRGSSPRAARAAPAATSPRSPSTTATRTTTRWRSRCSPRSASRPPSTSRPGFTGTRRAVRRTTGSSRPCASSRGAGCRPSRRASSRADAGPPRAAARGQAPAATLDRLIARLPAPGAPLGRRGARGAHGAVAGGPARRARASLDWDELRGARRRAGVDVGGHTVSHAVLAEPAARGGRGARSRAAATRSPSGSGGRRATSRTRTATTRPRSGERSREAGFETGSTTEDRENVRGVRPVRAAPQGAVGEHDARAARVQPGARDVQLRGGVRGAQAHARGRGREARSRARAGRAGGGGRAAGGVVEGGAIGDPGIHGGARRRAPRARGVARRGHPAPGPARARRGARVRPMLYSNPQFWWPWFERLRLAFVTAGLCGARGGRRTGSSPASASAWAAGPRRSSGPTSPSSPPRSPGPCPRATPASPIGEAWKMAVVFVAVQNVVDTRARLRRFLLVAALASLGPALGGIEVWRTGDALVDGFRTHWRGAVRRPEPARDGARRGPAVRALRRGDRAPAPEPGPLPRRRRRRSSTAVVLTHSRSGSIAAGVAVLLFLGARTGAARARAAVAAVALAVGLAAFAPETFWQRSATLANLEEDESVQGRENAWKVLGVDRRRAAAHRGRRRRVPPGLGALRAARGGGAPVHRAQHPARDRGRARRPRLRPLLRVLRVAPPAARGAPAQDPLVGVEARAIFAALAGLPRDRDGERLLAVLVPLLPVRVRGRGRAHRAARGRPSHGRRRDGSDEGARVPEPVPARRPGAADGDEHPDHGPDPVRAGGRLPARPTASSSPELAEAGFRPDRVRRRRVDAAPAHRARRRPASPASSGRTGSRLVHAQDLYTNTLGDDRGAARRRPGDRHARGPEPLVRRLQAAGARRGCRATPTACS